jgi:hypothetical protein
MATAKSKYNNEVNNTTICDIEHLENVFEIDIMNDIYPCRSYKCTGTKFIKSTNILVDAINYLCIERVEQLLNEMTIDELYSFRPYSDNKYKNTSLFNMNIIHYMLFVLGSTSGCEHIHVDIISVRDFDENNLFRNSHLSENKINARKQFITIFEIICKKVPQLIENKYFERVCNSKQLTAILATYYENENENENCFICQSSHNFQLLNMPCNCTSKIHLNCLVELYKTNGNICKTCHGELHGVTVCSDHALISRKSEIIIFPDLNIYVIFASKRYIIINTLQQKIDFAIAYLQVEKVKQLFESITNEEFITYVKSIKHYGYTYLLKPFRLSNNTGANILRNDKPYEYKMIDKIIKNKMNECGGEQAIFKLKINANVNKDNTNVI